MIYTVYSILFINDILLTFSDSLTFIIDGYVGEVVKINSSPLCSEFGFSVRERDSVWPNSALLAPFDKEV